VNPPHYDFGSSLFVFLQDAVNEIEQLLRWLVILLAQIGVDRAMILTLGGMGFRRCPGLLQRFGKTLRLCRRFWVVGNVQDQERRDALVLGDVRDR
jgi:hypothetical protein